jgi:hypothetical protein
MGQPYLNPMGQLCLNQMCPPCLHNPMGQPCLNLMAFLMGLALMGR